MKYHVIVCTALALTISAPAQADPVNFTGPALAVGVGSVRDQLSYRYSYLGFNTSKTGSGKSTKTNAIGKVDASYGFDLAPQWVASLGATYDLNEVDFATVTYRTGTTIKANAKINNHFSVYAAPGYRLSNDWLAYAKFGWYFAKGDYQTPTQKSDVVFDGPGYGLGLSTAITDHIEARVEAQYIDFRRITSSRGSADPSSIEGAAYLGYRF